MIFVCLFVSRKMETKASLNGEETALGFFVEPGARERQKRGHFPRWIFASHAVPSTNENRQNPLPERIRWLAFT